MLCVCCAQAVRAAWRIEPAPARPEALALSRR
jgi:hypothetical protein